MNTTRETPENQVDKNRRETLKMLGFGSLAGLLGLFGGGTEAPYEMFHQANFDDKIIRIAMV